jgi:hypothetical protein
LAAGFAASFSWPRAFSAGAFAAFAAAGAALVAFGAGVALSARAGLAGVFVGGAAFALTAFTGPLAAGFVGFAVFAAGFAAVLVTRLAGAARFVLFAGVRAVFAALAGFATRADFDFDTVFEAGFPVALALAARPIVLVAFTIFAVFFAATVRLAAAVRVDFVAFAMGVCGPSHRRMPR